MIGSIRSIANVNDSTKLDRQREVITRLKFIGTLQSGDKIDVSNVRIESAHFFTPLKRLLYGEGRDKTLGFLGVIVERSIEIIQSYLHSERLSEKIYCANIIHDLINAVVGLKNIQQTYADDNLFVCNIDALIENIDAKLTEIKEHYPEFLQIKPQTSTSSQSSTLSRSLTHKQNNDTTSVEVMIPPSSSKDKLLVIKEDISPN